MCVACLSKTSSIKESHRVTPFVYLTLKAATYSAPVPCGFEVQKGELESDFLELCLRIGQSEAKLLRPKQEMLEAQVNLGRDRSRSSVSKMYVARLTVNSFVQTLVRAEVRGFLSIFERPHFGQGRNCATPTAK